MSVGAWTWILVGATFVASVAFAVWAKARSPSAWYVAEQRVSPVAHGAATAAGWMSAATFVSMAGLLAVRGRDGAAYLVGWTGGYVLLAVLLAPVLRRRGSYGVPRLVSERWGSPRLRLALLACGAAVTFVYAVAQLRGVGVVLAHATGLPVARAVWLGALVVFLHAAAGGLRGLTFAAVAQYAVLILAYVLPAALLSARVVGLPVPQLALGAPLAADAGAAAPAGTPLVAALDALSRDLGLAAYSGGTRPLQDVVLTTVALMVGTAGLPHVLARFFTIPKVREARASAAWALAFIAVLYTTAPAMAAFGRLALATGAAPRDPDWILLATPAAFGLPAPAIALLAAGALAAAVSSASALVLLLAAAFSHDLLKGTLFPRASEGAERWGARAAILAGVALAALLAVRPPGSIAETVAFAFGLAAATLFPALALALFSTRTTPAGAAAGLAAGAAFTVGHILFFTALRPDLHAAGRWPLGVSPEGAGAVGMLLHVAVALAVSRAAPRAAAERA